MISYSKLFQLSNEWKKKNALNEVKKKEQKRKTRNGCPAPNVTICYGLMSRAHYFVSVVVVVIVVIVV